MILKFEGRHTAQIYDIYNEPDIITVINSKRAQISWVIYEGQRTAIVFMRYRWSLTSNDLGAGQKLDGWTKLWLWFNRLILTSIMTNGPHRVNLLCWLLDMSLNLSIKMMMMMRRFYKFTYSYYQIFSDKKLAFEDFDGGDLRERGILINSY